MVPVVVCVEVAENVCDDVGDEDADVVRVDVGEVDGEVDAVDDTLVVAVDDALVVAVDDTLVVAVVDVGVVVVVSVEVAVVLVAVEVAVEVGVVLPSHCKCFRGHTIRTVDSELVQNMFSGFWQTPALPNVQPLHANASVVVGVDVADVVGDDVTLLEVVAVVDVVGVEDTLVVPVVVGVGVAVDVRVDVGVVAVVAVVVGVEVVGVVVGVVSQTTVHTPVSVVVAVVVGANGFSSCCCCWLPSAAGCATKVSPYTSFNESTQPENEPSSDACDGGGGGDGADAGGSAVPTRRMHGPGVHSAAGSTKRTGGYRVDP